MGVKVSNVRSEAETARLMEQLSRLPKATTDAAPEPPKPVNTKWRHRSTTNAVGGRVNRTKGK
jgi:hypothetical protein